MKNNEQARVALLRLRFHMSLSQTAQPPGLVFGSLARCGRLFLGSLTPLVLIPVLALGTHAALDRLHVPKAPSFFLKALIFAANSLWGGAPRRLNRPR
jgi:hypothetical protein